ncbi:GxxExxY protein [Trichothermofontia sp.]
MQGALPERTEQVAKALVDAAFKVHSKLGPGLLESVYQACMVHELKKKGLFVEAEQPQPIIYEDIQIGSAFRLDLVVERCVIVELKAVEVILPVHRAQLLTYLKLSGHRLGFLVNFNVSLIKQGIQRFIV